MWVCEAVGGSAEGLDWVVGAFEESVGTAAVVPFQDLVGPVQDGVHGVVVLGNLTGFVEISKALERVQGTWEVIGLVEAVELL